MTGKLMEGLSANEEVVVRFTKMDRNAGIPKDATFVTSHCHEQCKDGNRTHDEGWLGAAGIAKLQELLYELHPNVEQTGIDELDLEHSIFHAYIGGNCIASHQGWDDVRIVYWFC